jgi:hypothetical protein
MSDYYVRVFCPAGDPPTPGDLIQWLDEREVKLRLKDADAKSQKDRNWSKIDLIYTPGKPPIPATCLRGDAARSEADRFLKQVGPVGSSRVKKRIAKALKETRFIVALQHPPGMEDAGYDASGQVLAYFDENNAALIQADKEGFYERSVCVLKIPDLK